MSIVSFSLARHLNLHVLLLSVYMSTTSCLASGIAGIAHVDASRYFDTVSSGAWNDHDHDQLSLGACNEFSWVSCPAGTGASWNTSGYRLCCGSSPSYCPSTYPVCAPAGCYQANIVTQCSNAQGTWGCGADLPYCSTTYNQCTAGTCSCGGCYPDPCTFNSCSSCSSCCKMYPFICPGPQTCAGVAPGIPVSVSTAACTGPPPSSCPQLSQYSLSHAFMQSTNANRIGSVATLVCDAGYETATTLTSKCMELGNWQPDIAEYINVCTGTPCLNVVPPLSGYFSSDPPTANQPYPYPTTITPQCYNSLGLFANGSYISSVEAVSSHCQMNHEWLPNLSETTLSCVPCPTHASVNESICLCDVNYYATKQLSSIETSVPSSAFVCSPCPSHSDTNGVRGATQCLCSAGYYADTAKNALCSACPLNTYKASSGSGNIDSCLQCPYNAATLTTASTSFIQCICNDNFILDRDISDCVVNMPDTYDASLAASFTFRLVLSDSFTLSSLDINDPHSAGYQLFTHNVLNDVLHALAQASSSLNRFSLTSIRPDTIANNNGYIYLTVQIGVGATRAPSPTLLAILAGKLVRTSSPHLLSGVSSSWYSPLSAVTFNTDPSYFDSSILYPPPPLLSVSQVILISVSSGVLLILFIVVKCVSRGAILMDLVTALLTLFELTTTVLFCADIWHNPNNALNSAQQLTYFVVIITLTSVSILINIILLCISPWSSHALSATRYTIYLSAPIYLLSTLDISNLLLFASHLWPSAAFSVFDADERNELEVSLLKASMAKVIVKNVGYVVVQVQYQLATQLWTVESQLALIASSAVILLTITKSLLAHLLQGRRRITSVNDGGYDSLQM